MNTIDHKEIEISKVAWQTPTIERIDIRKTLFGVGSATDGPSATT
jgi:hypothetical protein